MLLEKKLNRDASVNTKKSFYYYYYVFKLGVAWRERKRKREREKKGEIFKIEKETKVVIDLVMGSEKK